MRVRRFALDQSGKVKGERELVFGIWCFVLRVTCFRCRVAGDVPGLVTSFLFFVFGVAGYAPVEWRYASSLRDFNGVKVANQGFKAERNKKGCALRVASCELR